eukprot:TRINITY_DN9546_c0_g1_i1.p1 TRINITY_DN9546_c0_g1~~TRINITY_DN9546_c0_g1_i1.p1  ORF type:complete len:273 (-),score=103.66 TRINITY_DN9546_c0_g1_i1:289-1107(-)
MVAIEEIDEGEETLEEQHARLKEEAEWDDNNRALLAKGEKALSYGEWKAMQDDGKEGSGDAGDPDALLKDVKVQKEVGFGAYRHGNYEKAIVCWAMARDSLLILVDKKKFKGKEAKEAECKELLHTMYLNLAQAYLKNKEFHQAITHSDKILKDEPQNVKALYRKASAQLMASQHQEAKQNTRALLEVEPDNAAAKQLLLDIAGKEKAAKEKSKKASKIMLGGFDGSDPRTIEHANRVEEVEPLSERIWDFLEDVMFKCSTCYWCSKRKKVA